MQPSSATQTRVPIAGVRPGGGHGNASAESINGLYKVEVIHRCGAWRSLGGVGLATLEWMDWFNHRRLLETIGNIPPAEAEALSHAVQENLLLAA